jgi:hypothetical protein
LDPQKYLVVVLVVVLVVADVDAPIFSGRPHVRILSLHFNQYFVVILVESMDTRCAAVVAIPLTASKDDLKSNSKPFPIAE